MKIVLDTNVLLIALPKNSMYRPIFDAIVRGNLELAVSSEVLLEYEEVLTEMTNNSIAYNVLELLSALKNVSVYEIYFQWGFITKDWDDNKFVDLAIRSNSDFIVTNDKHFKTLKNVKFPLVKTIGSEEFLELLK